jgi:hypothetical protein
MGSRITGLGAGELRLRRWGTREMNWRIVLITGMSLTSLTGCDLEPTRTEEGVLRAAFTALRKDRWEDYSKLTITMSDFILKEHKINRFAEKQSFAGGILKPEEKAQQKAAYLRAVRGGAGLIDFRRAQFLRAGSVLDEGKLESLSGREVPFRRFSIRMRSGRAEVDSRALSPRFVVVPWQGGYRLLRLEFGDP